MTQAEFAHLRDVIKDLTTDQLSRLREDLDGRLSRTEQKQEDLEVEDRIEQELQRRLFDAGILQEIKPPRRTLAVIDDLELIEIEGEPLSATILRERR